MTSGINTDKPDDKDDKGLSINRTVLTTRLAGRMPSSDTPIHKVGSIYKVGIPPTFSACGGLESTVPVLDLLGYRRF